MGCVCGGWGVCVGGGGGGGGGGVICNAILGTPVSRASLLDTGLS